MIIAYIDPGAGSMVIQAVIAAALAIPFFLRTRIASLVSGLKSRRRDGPPRSEDG